MENETSWCARNDTFANYNIYTALEYKFGGKMLVVWDENHAVVPHDDN